jgi:hypothetical protein
MSGKRSPETKTAPRRLASSGTTTETFLEIPMSRSFASPAVTRKIDRTSYTPQASLPLMPPITPSQLAAEIKALLASSQEVGRRQDALMSKVRGMAPLPPIAGGSPDAEDRRIDEMYERARWIDRLDSMNRSPEDELL